MTPEERQAARARCEAASKPIPGYPGYEADENGRIWSVGHNWRGYGRRELSRYIGPYKYLVVRLTVDGKRTRVNVHKLVALAWLPGPIDGQQIRHLDGNPMNNRPANLRWGTAQDNAEDRERHGRTRRGSSNGEAKLREWHIPMIRERLVGGQSQRAIAVVFGVSQRTIGRIARKETWTHVV